jgi:beta-ribofuranosylaminobenzene 5'-phosphate synthase
MLMKNCGTAAMLCNSKTENVRVIAPARLHFGLFSIGAFSDLEEPLYGGVGAMIDGPNVELVVSPADRFYVEGTLPKRIRETALQWLEAQGCELQIANQDRQVQSLDDLPCKIDLINCPQLHTGLGVGTQLALSVVAGLSRFFDIEIPAPERISEISGRGRRSAIGTWGFWKGGLIVDGGRNSQDQTLGTLEKRLDIPKAWRVVVMTIDQPPGMSGEFETSAFTELAKSNSYRAEAMREICELKIVPGLQLADFDLFSRGIYEFNFRVGQRFSKIQLGPFNGPAVSRCIHTIRDMGFAGVGQSSWGPSIFAWTQNEEAAQWLLAGCLANPDIPMRQSWIAKANETGARIESVQA